MRRRPLHLLAALLLAPLFSPLVEAQQKLPIIHPGDTWLDNRGQVIEAHGGGILKLKNTWYWFGEDRTPSNDPSMRFVSCYSSDDLVHWKFRNQVLKLSDPEQLGPNWVLERPKVFYNARTHTFVLYAHLDDSRYKVARVAVATSHTVDGVYHFVKSFRPLDQESRDIGHSSTTTAPRTSSSNRGRPTASSSPTSPRTTSPSTGESPSSRRPSKAEPSSTTTASTTSSAPT